MSERVDKAGAMSLGADDYIIKPFELEQLLTMAKNWMSSGSIRKKQMIIHT